MHASPLPRARHRARLAHCPKCTPSARHRLHHACAVLTLGPKEIPPPGKSGEVREPRRALPVPFCPYGFLPPPDTSARVCVEAVPCGGTMQCGVRVSPMHASALCQGKPNAGLLVLIQGCHVLSCHAAALLGATASRCGLAPATSSSTRCTTALRCSPASRPQIRRPGSVCQRLGPCAGDGEAAGARCSVWRPLSRAWFQATPMTPPLTPALANTLALSAASHRPHAEGACSRRAAEPR
jgi:hypothetical protein